jgi:hypothetical protein
VRTYKNKKLKLKIKKIKKKKPPIYFQFKYIIIYNILKIKIKNFGLFEFLVLFLINVQLLFPRSFG